MSSVINPPRSSSLSMSMDESPHYGGEQVPVLLELNGAKIDKLGTEYQEIVERIANLAENELSEWDSFDVYFPESKFDDGAPIVNMSDLFKAPDNSELRRLVLDEDGKFTPLTDEQWEQIRRTGTFEIASEDFEGQKHIWRVSRILQKGAEPIQRTHENHLGTVYDQLATQIPERLSLDGSVSVGRGIRNVYHALRAIPAFAIGLPEVKRRYDQWDIESEIEKEARLVLRQKLVEHHDGDTRLYDKEISESLLQILNDLRRAWSKHRAENHDIWAQSLIEKSSGQGTNYSRSAMDRLEDEEYCTFVENYGPLEAAEPGYGLLLADVRRLESILKAFENDFRSLSRQERAHIEAQLKEHHRIKSKSAGWLRDNVNGRMDKFLKDPIWQKLEQKAADLDKSELALEAAAYRALIQFKRDREPALQKALEAETVPSRTFRVKTHIWRSKNWKKKELKTYNNETVYELEKNDTSEVKTDHLFWRLHLAASQGVAAVKNGLHNVIVSNLWNGSLGIRSLFSKEPFYSEKTIEAKTGQIIDDPHSKTHTLRSRYHGLWSDIAESRQKFEDRPDEGILPKNFSRGLHRIYHNGIRGVGGTLFLVTGQPLATGVNVVASSVAAATAPIWGSIIPVTKYGLAPLLFDANSPGESENGNVRRFFPIIGHTVSDFAIGGIGQAVTAAASAAVLHPAAAGATGAYAGLRKYTRKAYDFTVAHVILRKGRQPATDTWLNQRIHGPGLSENYFFQVRPEIAVLALQAELEKVELEYFRKDVEAAIKKPGKDYRAFFRKLLGSMGSMNVSSSATAQRLQEVEDLRLKELDQECRKQEVALAKISHIQVDERRIRQVSADLEETLALATELVQSFYEEKIEPYMSKSQTRSFWINEHLKVGDFEGLAKHYLATVFSSEFLVPMEVHDEDFIIDVSDPDAKQFLNNLMHPKA